jgi:hypothetical protein
VLGCVVRREKYDTWSAAIRTIDRVRASSFRPRGGLRLVSMITMLFVLALLISRAADPQMWIWLVGGKAEVAEPVKAEPPKVAANAVKVVMPTDEQQPEIVPGPIDTDPEEWSAASEQFQALSDGALLISGEEMPAYWRLFRWTRAQTYAELLRRADLDPAFKNFVHFPDEQRGKLFRLRLNVRSVLAYDAPANSAGVKKVYELSGPTEESGAWICYVLTDELPPGMPVGPKVYERVTFAGYFFKIQGYHPAGAGPRDKPLAAPLFIGRLSWKPSPGAAKPVNADWTWLWWLAAIAVFYLGARLSLWALSTRPPRQEQTRTFAPRSKSADLQNWLAEAEAGERPGGEGGLDGITGTGDSGRAGPADFRHN